MIPYLLAAVGGYLLGNSSKEEKLLSDEAILAKGGKTKDMSIQFIEYKDKTILYEPNNKEYFTNDIEFKSLADAKKYIDSGSPDPSWEKYVYAHGYMADGGEVNLYFNDIDSEVEYFNPSSETLVIKIEVDLTDKTGMEDYGEREYKFELSVDEDGYSIYKIFDKDGVQVSKEEQKFLENHPDISSAIEEKYRTTWDNYYKYDDYEEPDEPYPYNDDYYKNGGNIKKIGPFRQSVKEDAQNYSRRNKTKTYVFDYEFMKHNGQPTTSLSERFTYGTQEDLDYMKEKGFDKYFKVIAIYDNGKDYIDGLIKT